MLQRDGLSPGSGSDTDTPDDLTIHADYDRLLRVFENLFRNAVEHNDPPVTVRVGMLERPASETHAAGLAVEDDGSGLTAEDPEIIFDQGYSTNDGGTGLGLSIVKDIVEAHGWSINVTESEMGGVRFEITGVVIVE